ncbi:hydroxymethylglutaryl-CoA reductase (NADPH) [Exophiala oligosperma]|uniref:3-hydroxy-3-methylglutaryl coenzyme A reductase n=2 Tax=Chaetothyriales TaxID=34395 RepID=A0A0D2AKU7_9EURO|nr:hydroxymethylglutaryl-CoA reductase (NADPH) [Exophiala oligosperma]KAJ9645476.1 3-hydroxy-3-methylglutaryl-coenzyme A (HMG-CoA) reductase isozyme [Knufia peltigerae]KIW40656.1 hydroxymethylglutaryl-CoA reductase (NADPH) [Exophiala oligosperma]
MRGSHLLPKQLRSLGKSDSWLNRTVTSNLLATSHVACQHPIHTIVAIALLASTSYIGLLQESLFDSGIKSLQHNGRVDVEALLKGSRTLELSQNTAWKWQFSDDSGVPEVSLGPNHYALTTFVFPDSSSAPDAQSIPIPVNVTATNVPTTSNLLSPISHDTSLAFYTTFSELPDFLRAAQELPAQNVPSETDEQASWTMKAARVGNGQATYATWFREGWTSFVDLIKHAETLDIIIMALGYLSMHLTFISLFLSMKRLGSNAWLAVSVLFSSLFAFLFGLVTTTKLGVPINMVLLSEGLPFLVVTVGFEKSIILTKAVLSASYDTKRRPTANGSANGNVVGPVVAPNAPNSIQDAIQIAIKETGFEIVRDYAVEIAILIAGAASGVQGGLRQFCFLAAWILFYDCVLLFTWYTTILCIKLEINRIKRHVALRKTLEEDGINHRVAENVASNSDWPNGPSGQTGFNIFGQKIRASSVPKFKIWMVGGFVIINIVNLCTIPFRTSTTINAPGAAMPSVLTPAPIDPFKVAENGLDSIYVSAKSRKLDTFVTVIPPIKYEIDYPSAQQDAQDVLGWFDQEYTDQFLNVVGGRVIEGVLKSLEDPVLSKWVLIALTLSLILNGYLFNAARWSLKEPQSSTSSPAGPQVPKLELPQTPKPKPLNIDLQAASGRSKEECEQMLKDKKAAYLTDEELIDLSLKGKIPGYAIEKTLEAPELMTRLDSFVRAVKVRRAVVSRTSGPKFAAGLEVSKSPYRDYNYELVHGACCENVIGYLPLPLGVAGPIIIDGQSYFLPMATTEGVLVASTSRGCKAINAGGGASTIVTGDGMTRGPCMSFPTVSRTGEAKIWLDSEEGQRTMREAFNSTSRFARLQSMKSAIAGTNLFVRFKTTTGDAMGMNMISKGVEKALSVMSTECGFEDMTIVSLSGNYCIDKKASAINWIDGRGKAVVAEAIIPGDVVRNVLKSNVDDLVELNVSKNLIGSAMAGSIGGNNAHAANIVAAIFLATGQDPAQVVESASCMTLMKNNNGNLQISVSMPCLEVGTIGGGTILEAQSSMLDLLGVRGAHQTTPGDNARQLARIIAAAVLAGELSLCAALRAGHLVKAHMAHNRSAAPTRTSTPVSAAVEPFLKAQNGPNVPASLRMTNGNGR